MIGIKSLSRRTKITGAGISDGVGKRDGLSTLPTQELVDGLMTWTERQRLLNVDRSKGDVLMKSRGTYVA